MSSSILVTSAALYVEAFYRALAEGLSVSIAQEQARQALHKDPHRHLFSRRQDEEATPVTLADWWIPHFYQQRALTLHATTMPRKRTPQQTNSSARFNDAMPPEPRYQFGGRAWELLQIERHLWHKRLVVLSGFGGVGKTALAREVAHWLTRTGMYSCACFISFEHGGDASLLLSTLGTFLGVNDGNYTPQNPDTALTRLQPILQTRPTLVIADNLESLLPTGNAPLERTARNELWQTLSVLATFSAGVLLTSRDPLTSEDQLTSVAHVADFPLGGLTSYDAYALTTRLLEDLSIDRIRAPYAELHNLLLQLDYHPLAIQLVLPTLRMHTLDIIRADFTKLLFSFADNTATGHNRSLLVSLDYSLRHLTPDQRTRLRNLVIFEGGAMEQILLQITKISEEEWINLRTVLERAALLTIKVVYGNKFDFLHFHPVLIPYLRSLYAVDEILLTEYINVYISLALHLYSEDHHYPQAVRAMIWLELPNLRHVLELLLAESKVGAATIMADLVTWFLNSFGMWRERDTLWQKLVEAADVEGSQYSETLTSIEYTLEMRKGIDEFAKGDIHAAYTRFAALLTRAEALPEGVDLAPGSIDYNETLLCLARCLRDSGQSAAAEAHIRKALMSPIHNLPDGRQPTVVKAPFHEEAAFDDEFLKRDVEDHIIRQRAILHLDLGSVLRNQGKYQQAKEVYQKGLQIAEQLDEPSIQASSRAHLGNLATKQGMYDEARFHYLQALKLLQALEAPIREAGIWNNLGAIEIERKNWVEAERCFRQSLILAEQGGTQQR